MSLYTPLVNAFPFLRKPLYNILYDIIARKQRRDNHNLTNQLKLLKNSHLGESCFIIGTGPSLKVDDLKILEEKDIPTFAPNRIYEICESSGWQPKYYICQDHNIIQTFKDRIKGIKSELSFLPVDYKDEFKGSNYRFFVLHECEYYPQHAKFSKDISKDISQGYTVTYAAIQLAIYMGFKNIYLLGIDHNYNITRDSKGRPVRNSTETQNYSNGMTDYVNTKNLPRIEESTIAYETAERMSKKLSVKIYNATRGGKLDAFERISFEDAIKQIKQS